MANTAIMTKDTINALSNKELKADLRTMLTALESGKKATWVYAHSVSNIVKGESFKEDFETIKNFADFVNMTKGAISQMTKAVEFVTKNNLVGNDKKGKPDYGTVTITVSNAYLLSVLTDEEFKDFSDYCDREDINMYLLSQNKLKDALKAWKETKEADDVVDTEGEEIEEKEEKEEKKADSVRVEVDTKEKALVVIVTLMKKFNINIIEIEKSRLA